MNVSALSASFEYLFYRSTAIIHIFTLIVRGCKGLISQIQVILGHMKLRIVTQLQAPENSNLTAQRSGG